MSAPPGVPLIHRSPPPCLGQVALHGQQTCPAHSRGRSGAPPHHDVQVAAPAAVAHPVLDVLIVLVNCRLVPSACAAAPPQLPLLAVAARPSRSPEQARPRRRVQVQLVPADAALGPLALDEQYVSNCVRRRPAPSLPARVARPSSPCPPPCSTHTPLPRHHPRPPAAARARARPPARVLARAGPPVGPGGAAERRAVRRVQVQLATDTARPV